MPRRLRAYRADMVLHPQLTALLVQAHVDERLRNARRQALGESARGPWQPASAGAHVPISIRLARPDDGSALARLAELDSATLPAPPVLVAQADGEIRVALSLTDGGVIADPFHPTEALTQLLITRAIQLLGERPRRWRRLLRRCVAPLRLRSAARDPRAARPQPQPEGE